MNSFNKPQTNYNNIKQTKNPNQESYQNAKNGENIMSANTNKNNDYLDSMGNINFGRNQGNSSNYMPNENMNLHHQSSNFYGPGFLRTPHSPEQMKALGNFLPADFADRMSRSDSPCSR